MKLLGDYIKSRRGVLLFFALAAVLLGVSFALFHLPLRAVAYPCALTLLLGLAALALDFRRVYKLHRELSQLETTASELIGVLPAAASVPETDYQAIVQSLCRRICRNLGHTITAESRPGEGTTVRIKLEEKKITVE